MKRTYYYITSSNYDGWMDCESTSEFFNIKLENNETLYLHDPNGNIIETNPKYKNNKIFKFFNKVFNFKRNNI